MSQEQQAPPANQPLSKTNKVVLSLDGGGIRGLATARILTEMEERTGQPIHKLFNVVVGTSTGGLIAVLLTIPTSKTTKEPGITPGAIMSAREVFNLYWNEAKNIFRERWMRKIIVLYPIDILRNSRYNQDGLMNVINKVYLPEDFKSLADAHPDLHVGLCCSDKWNRKSILLNSYRARADPHDWRHSAHLMYTILATSAAPTFFNPLYLNRNDELPVDKKLVKDKTSILEIAKERRQLKNEREDCVHKKVTNKHCKHAEKAIKKQDEQEFGRPRTLSVDWYDPVTEEKPTVYARREIIFEDGGVTRNNPSQLALKFAKKLIIQEGQGQEKDIMKNIKIVSIGTGSKYFAGKNPNDPKDPKDRKERREMDPSEYRGLWGNPDGRKHWAIARPFRAIWRYFRIPLNYVFEGNGYGVGGVLNRWASDPFDLSQNAWNSHVKMLDAFHDVNLDDNYIRLQYDMEAHLLEDMSRHDEATMTGLIRACERYIYKDWDYENNCKVNDELSDDFKKILDLVYPSWKYAKGEQKSEPESTAGRQGDQCDQFDLSSS